MIKARADRDVAEGMVFIPFCFAEAAANLLTNPQLDPMGKIPEFKFCAAKVERRAMMESWRSEAGPRISYAVRGSASLRFCAAKVEPAYDGSGGVAAVYFGGAVARIEGSSDMRADHAGASAGPR